MPREWTQYEGSKRNPFAAGKIYKETGATEPDSEEVSRSREKRESKTETNQG